MEPVLKPLVYSEPARARRAPPRTRRAGLHRLGDAAGDRRGARRELGFDGALGSTCEIVEASTPAARCAPATGRGRPPRSAGSPSGRASTSPRRTAYSDSHTDLPFLEAVGNPIAVNPDRELRRDRGRSRLAGARVQRARVSGGRGRPAPGAARHPARARSRRRRLGGVPPCCLRSAEPGSPRSASTRPTSRRSSTTSTTPSAAASSATGTRGSTGSRRCPISTRARSRSAARSSRRLRALGRRTVRSAT